MSEVLANLHKKGGGGQLSETILWTNPNGGASLSAGTITLSDSISNYDFIGVEYCYDSEYQNVKATAMMSVSDFMNCVYSTSTSVARCALVLGAERVRKWCRFVYYVSDTSIYIYTGMAVNQANTATDASNPIKVIGYKF